jgi:hypothetical protein
VERATVLWRSDQQQCPDVRAATAITGTAAIVPVREWENPPDDVDVSRPGNQRVGAADVAMVRAGRTRYEQMYRAAGGGATKGRVVGSWPAAPPSCCAISYTDEAGRELYRASGGPAVIAGICAHDGDAQCLAQRYSHHALRLAKASADQAPAAT